MFLSNNSSYKPDSRAKNIQTNITVAREKFAQKCGAYAEKDGETLIFAAAVVSLR
jgi:hypothetical protein